MNILGMNTLGFISFILGLIAAVCIGIYTIPQLIMLLKTKDSSGISAPMFLILVIGDIFFIAQSSTTLINSIAQNDIKTWLTTLFPVLIANTVCTISGTITLTIKLLNQHRAKKLNLSEREYCAQLSKKSNAKKSNKNK